MKAALKATCGVGECRTAGGEPSEGMEEGGREGCLLAMPGVVCCVYDGEEGGMGGMRYGGWVVGVGVDEQS